MKIFMIGGTGLLGSEAAKELINRGHEVTSIALPPLPKGTVLPEKM
jgi:putative NADH-flavin reductase